MDALITTADAIARAVHSDKAAEGHWYALYTCPHHEKRVAEQIEQRSISCFLPVYRSVRRWKDRRKELELALFPGYVFVHIGLQAAGETVPRGRGPGQGLASA